MTAPEPVEVPAAELAAARPRCAYWCDYRDTSHEGPCLPNPTRRIADLTAERDRLRAFLLEATGTLPAHGFADNELGDPWPRWLERVAAYLTETHR